MKLIDIIEQQQSDEPQELDQEIKQAAASNNRALLALLNRKKILLQNLQKLQADIARLDAQIANEKQRMTLQQQQNIGG